MPSQQAASVREAPGNGTGERRGASWGVVSPRMLPPALLVVLACVVAGCVTPTAGSPAAGSPAPGASVSVLTGRVTAGPVCPVERYPPASVCADRPVSGALLVIEDGDGRKVAEVRSGADGGFRVELPPGSYRIVPQPVAGLIGTAQPVDLRLEPGASASPIAVRYDTGIR
jgi:hypothetical protein